MISNPFAPSNFWLYVSPSSFVIFEDQYNNFEVGSERRPQDHILVLEPGAIILRSKNSVNDCDTCVHSACDFRCKTTLALTEPFFLLTAIIARYCWPHFLSYGSIERIHRAKERLILLTILQLLTTFGRRRWDQRLRRGREPLVMENGITITEEFEREANR